MTEQDEDPAETLRRKFSGPNRDKRDFAHNPVLDHKIIYVRGKAEDNKGEETDFASMENTGLMFCPSIMRAIDMIEANPIGFEISTL